MATVVLAGLASAIGAAAAQLTLFGLGAIGSFFAAFAIGAGLSLVSQALAPKLDLGTQMGGRSVMTREAAQSRKIIYGRARIGGNIVYLESTGSDNKYLYLVIAVAGHSIDAYEEVYFNDEKIYNGTSFINGWANFVNISFYKGDQTAADSGLVTASATNNGKWTTDHKLLDTAYMVVRLEHDVDKFAQGLPNISTVIRGKKVLDPSDNSIAWSQNPALCIYDYLRDTKYGLGESAANILTSSVTTAKGVCDETVDLAAGGTQPRYTIDGVVDTASSIKSNMEIMTGSMIGRLIYSGGKFEIHAGEYVAPTITIDESMAVGEITVQTKQSRRNAFNGVKGVFVSQDDNYIVADYPAQISSTFAAQDGDPIYLDMALPFTINNIRAQRIAKLALLRSRQQEAITIPCNLTALKFKIGDNISVSNTRLGYSGKVFEVVGYSMAFNAGQMVVNVEAIETAANIWDWQTSDEEVFLGGGEVDLYDGKTATAPTELSIVGDTFVSDDGAFNVAFDVSWVDADDAFTDHYVVEWKPITSANYFSQQTKSSPFTIVNLQSLQQYNVRVKAVNELGVSSDFIVSAPTAAKDTTAPSAPTAMSVTGTFKTLTVAWTVPPEKDFKFVDIKRSVDSTESNAVYLDQGYGESFDDVGYTSEVTRYFWLRSVDRSGNASAWVFAGNATSTLVQAADLADGVVDLDILSSDLQGTIAGKAEQVDVDLISNEVKSEKNKLIDEATNTLSLALLQNEATTNISRAGITVDEATGAVTIQAVQSLKNDVQSQINTVSVDLDAAEATINLKASTSYVNDAIAAAVLDSADLASLSALEAKVAQAEIDIDGAEASILLKSNITTVAALDVRVDSAEVDIDAAEAAILLKASATDLTALTSRVSTAEVEINALDIPSITQTVIDSRTLKNDLDTSAITTLEGLLSAYKDQEEIRTDLAFAQSSISAYVNDVRQASATDRTALAALIDDNKATILSESTARADADTALTTSVNALTATVGTNTANITTEQVVRADAVTALAADISSLTSTVGGNTATISTNQQTNVTALGTLNAKYGVSLDVNGYVTGFIQNNDGTSGSMIIATDNFQIVDPDAAKASVPVFTYTDSKVRFGSDVEVNAATIVVDDLSAIKSNLGTITAGSIDGVTVKIGQGSSVFKADTNGIYLGDEVFANAEFSVSPQGALTATSANITGNITATSGSIANGVTIGGTAANTVTSGALSGATALQDADTGVDLGLTSGSISGITISATKLHEGIGTFNNANTGFYLDNTGQFSLKNKLSFDGATLAIDGNITADNLNVTNATVTGSFVANNLPNLENLNGAVGTGNIANDAITNAQIAVDSIQGDVIAAGAIVTTMLGVDAVTSAKIADNAVLTAAIAADAVTTVNIAENAVTSAVIAAGAITATELGVDAVTSAKIADNAITAAQIGAGAITTAKIANDAVTSAVIAAGAITSSELGVDAVTSAKIANNAITAAQIGANAVTTAKIANNAVTSAVIAAGAITATELGANAVTTAKLANNAVTSAVIAAGAITASELGIDAVTAAKIAENAVTADAIGADAVLTAAIADNAITNALIATDAVNADNIIANAITATEIATGAITANEIAANAVTAAKIEAGTITASEIAAGAITATEIAADAITATKIATDAITADAIEANAVTASEIAANTITASQIAAEAITANELSANSVTADAISAGTITATELAANSVTASQIAANAVTASEIAAGTITASELAVDSVTASQIAAGSVTASEIAANTITASQIAADAITANEIATDAVTADAIEANTITAAEIAANAITASEIAADAITADAIAANAITAGAIEAGTITAADIAANAITSNEIAANTISANEIAANAVTADAIAANTITAAEIAANTVTASQIAADAITADEIAANAVTASAIAANTITASEIAADAVTANAIEANAVTANEIAANAVTANEIAANAVTANAIAANAVTADSIEANAVTAVAIAANTITASEIAANTVTASEIAAGTITATEIAAGTITANQIASNTITSDEIAAGTITATEIAADAITATEIAANSVTADAIAANAVTASEINVENLAAINADMGTITAGSMSVGLLTGDVTESYPLMLYPNSALSNSVQTVSSFSLPAPSLGINKRQKLAFNTKITIRNTNNSAVGTYAIRMDVQKKSKGVNAVSVGTVTVVSFANFVGVLYVSGNKLGVVDGTGGIADSASPSGVGNVQGVYYDQATNRTYITYSDQFNRFSNGETAYYSDSKFTSAGTWVTPSSGIAYQIRPPSGTNSFEDVNIPIDLFFGSSTTATDFRVRMFVVQNLSGFTFLLSYMRGFMENTA